jgi:hypothetical protein
MEKEDLSRSVRANISFKIPNFPMNNATRFFMSCKARIVSRQFEAALARAKRR